MLFFPLSNNFAQNDKYIREYFSNIVFPIVTSAPKDKHF